MTDAGTSLFIYSFSHLDIVLFFLVRLVPGRLMRYQTAAAYRGGTTNIPGAVANTTLPLHRTVTDDCYNTRGRRLSVIPSCPTERLRIRGSEPGM